MGASTKQGYEIAKKSRKIVRLLIEDKIKNFSKEERKIIERVVHSTADLDFAELIEIHPNFVNKSLEALNNNEDIFVDVKMVKVGINKYPGNILCYIDDKDVIKLAKKKQITRAAASVEHLVNTNFNGIVVIGNSPTALYKIIEFHKKNKLKVKSVIGVPVGFVSAEEAKEMLKDSGIPYLITRGPKGGTSVAVAAINSLINMRDKNEF
nr:cobalt-precorrin-8 methylmutase [Methanothermus fervidus]